jgi:hypothetical protein
LCAVAKQQARVVFNYCKAPFACRRCGRWVAGETAEAI